MGSSPSAPTPGVFLLCLLQVAITEAQNCGEGSGQDSCHSHWTRLWYVWLILLTVFLLLVCGVAASCVKCCRRAKPQIPTFATRPCEVTVIAIDNDSTISPNSSLQYVSAGRNRITLQDPTQFMLPPPPYSLCAIDNPPTYEMALKMAKLPEISEPESGAENSSGNGTPIPERNDGSSSAEGMSERTSSALSQQ
ncbi:transmembrane protein 52-like [Pristis pectinata]|uniref:transmembrane protein 52-like n=1 Tax=Pristis pectinata TaxID=685728 RepID=UPI00223E4F20|nr:transmembrane protein 52-like [Pristis pectinata]